jgi:hypothetical protein
MRGAGRIEGSFDAGAPIPNMWSGARVPSAGERGRHHHPWPNLNGAQQHQFRQERCITLHLLRFLHAARKQHPGSGLPHMGRRPFAAYPLHTSPADVYHSALTSYSFFCLSSTRACSSCRFRSSISCTACSARPTGKFLKPTSRAVLPPPNHSAYVHLRSAMPESCPEHAIRALTTRPHPTAAWMGGIGSWSARRIPGQLTSLRLNLVLWTMPWPSPRLYLTLPHPPRS